MSDKTEEQRLRSEIDTAAADIEAAHYELLQKENDLAKAKQELRLFFARI